MLKKQQSDPQEGVVKWRCPSNIALVKYWGKYGDQLPMNSSLSLTLQDAYTTTQVSYRSAVAFSVKYLFEGQENEQFSMRIKKYLEHVYNDIPWIQHMSLEISSENSFPHSAGIASSASAFGALALCLCSIEQSVLGTLDTDDAFYQKASRLARLGSGSAARSVYGQASIWGGHAQISGTSNDYAIRFELPEYFKGIRDAILLVSKKEKAVSSSAGHGLMKDHPYRTSRINHANKNLNDLVHSISNGDQDVFSQIVENEAMTLHGLMMSSTPSFILLEPDSIKIIQSIKDFRAKANINMCFTIDAGPNIHLLYHEDDKDKVCKFIEKQLEPIVGQGNWIDDCVGEGPERLV